MVSENKKKARLQIPELEVNRETMQDLTETEAGEIKGGVVSANACSLPCQDPIPLSYRNCGPEGGGGTPLPPGGGSRAC